MSPFSAAALLGCYRPSLDFSRGARSAGEYVVRTNLAERKEHSDVSGHTFPEMISGKGEIVKEPSAAFWHSGRGLNSAERRRREQTTVPPDGHWPATPRSCGH